MCKTIGILSLKGGVGKTSAVLSLGSAISEFGKRVLLIDGNFSAPNLGIHLNVIEPENTIHHVLNGDQNIEDAIINLSDFDLDLIPASINYRSQINPFKLKDKIKLLKDRYDVILIDSSPALNDETLSVMLASDEIFIVTTPDYPTLSMTMKAINDAKKRGVRIDGLILNKVYNKPFELSIGDIEKTVDIPVLAVIPHDVDVVKSVSKFSPAFFHNPQSRGSIEYRKLAGVIIGEKYKPSFFKRLFGRVPHRQDVNRELFYESIFG
ncbi:MAG: MinD/ParA family protein [Candidatus Nanoarchaeia archaeon]|nr:MinD/ParA family protein [Candidatus Nanoarchaeia archaeon]